MATPTVYVLCDQNCKYEGLTREQILSAITQAVSTGQIKDVDTGFITTIKTINNASIKFFYGTQAAHNALTEEQKENLFAIITDDTTTAGILNAIEELTQSVEDMQSGKVAVGSASKLTAYAGPATTARKTVASVRSELTAWLANVKSNCFAQYKLEKVAATLVDLWNAEDTTTEIFPASSVTVTVINNSDVNFLYNSTLLFSGAALYGTYILHLQSNGWGKMLKLEAHYEKLLKENDSLVLTESAGYWVSLGSGRESKIYELEINKARYRFTGDNGTKCFPLARQHGTEEYLGMVYITLGTVANGDTNAALIGGKFYGMPNTGADVPAAVYTLTNVKLYEIIE